MSSLIFYTDETQIVVATDSLAVDENGNPAFFCSKAVHIPHLKTVIAGTGASGFANEWALNVSTRMVLAGIHNLDYHTPEGLRNLWEEYKKRYSYPDNFTTTVYQFGISEESENVVSFAYRSVNNFVSEEVGYGTGVKPECSIQTNGSLNETIPLMMKEQREIQEKVPMQERVFIGGEIITFHLTENGCSTFKLGQFDDLNEQKETIFKNYAK